MSKKAIILDMDNTIYPVHSIGFKLFKVLFDLIEESGDHANIEEIKAAISNCGYDADDIPAFEEAYKRLPKTCKKPEDGGPTKAPNIHAPPAVKQ